VTLVWTDSIDGGPPVEIGTGPSPTVRLRTPCESARHQLTLTATDNVRQQPAGRSERDCQDRLLTWANDLFRALGRGV
jgi:hypothetical protein